MRGCTILTLVAMATLASAQNISEPTETTNNFGDLPEGNYTSSTVSQIDVGSLQGLFDMAQGFVNVVFKPFAELQDVISEIISAKDPLEYLIQNWQDVAQFEAGYIACLVFGLLFILFVPLIGSFMCCCRSCCGNCGGRLEQSTKRSKSCWRQCLCVTMLCLTTFMAVPTVFVFLTNEWITDVIDIGPTEINAILGDGSEYVTLVPKQVQYITDQYTTVDENVRPLVSDFGMTIGIPLMEMVEELAEESLDLMDTAIEEVNNTVKAIDDVDNSLSALNTGIVTVNISLNALQANMTTALNVLTCSNDPSCQAVFLSRLGLTLGIDVDALNSLSSDLTSVNSSLTGYDLSQLRQDIDDEINSIPNTTREQTKDVSEDAEAELDKANETMSTISSSFPTESLDDLDKTIKDLQDTITDVFATYNDNFDKYRYIAGLVLGSMLALIVVSYILGMFLGVCGNDRKVSPSERGCSSNCGGIMLMVGVGFSFIFSWLLMILVVVTFTIGGHSERYGCQSLEGPNYEAFQILENSTQLDITGALNLPEDAELTLSDILKSCEKNAPAYDAFKLYYLINITKTLDDVDNQVANLTSTVDGVNVDLSSIEVYSDSDQTELLKLNNSGLDSIDFTYYTEQLGDGIVAINLTRYAEQLRGWAANFTSLANAAHFNEVMGYADEVDRIQNDTVEPLQKDYDLLEESIDVLTNQSKSLSSTIIELDDALIGLNESIQLYGEPLIESLTQNITDQVIGNITDYTSWVDEQVTSNVGACRPVYDAYAGTLGIFCDYLIDTINGLWFSLGWCVFFLIPSAIIAMKLMKFFRKMSYQEQYEDSWDEMQMRDYGAPTAGNTKQHGGY